MARLLRPRHRELHVRRRARARGARRCAARSPRTPRRARRRPRRARARRPTGGRRPCVMRGLCPREGDPHPRGRRPGGAPLRGRRRIRSPATGEVLVELRAASLNHLDVWIRKGLPSVPKPRILGADGAGVIAGTDERVVINPGIIDGRQDAHRRRDDGRHARRADRDAARLRPPHPRRALVRGGGRVPARVRDGVPDARHARAAAGRRVGADLGHRRRRRDGGALDREGARRARRRHLVERREARARARARRRRDRQPRDRRRRRAREGA